MRELFKLTATQALSAAVYRVMELNPELSETKAKELVKNALIYNCVIEEIAGQVNFLLEKEKEEDSIW